MKILVCEPGKHPYVKDIEHTLENLQHEVDGYIQAIYTDKKITPIYYHTLSYYVK